MEPSEAMANPVVIQFLTLARVARLATVSGAGVPHNVPLCFCLAGERFYFVIDQKPKRQTGLRLKRMRNIGENPHVALLVDHFEEDWASLAYVLVQGTATVVEDPDEYLLALRHLRDKYPQYREMPLRRENNLMVRVEPANVHFWGARFQAAAPSA